MLVDLRVEGKLVVVVGGGCEGYRKTLDFTKAGSKVLVISKEFSEEIQTLCKAGKICLQKEKVTDPDQFIESFEPKPDIIVAITNDHELNKAIIKKAKSSGCLAYAPDNPTNSDFILPAIAKIGDVQIAISTSGKSPAMASILRKRIEKTITPEDLLQIKLQNDLRQTLKKQVIDQKTRREILYNIIEDANVQTLLKEGKYQQAKEASEKILNKTIPSK